MLYLSHIVGSSRVAIPVDRATSVKNEVSMKTVEVLRIEEEKCEKIAAVCIRKDCAFVLCHGCQGFEIF